MENGQYKSRCIFEIEESSHSSSFFPVLVRGAPFLSGEGPFLGVAVVVASDGDVVVIAAAVLPCGLTPLEGGGRRIFDPIEDGSDGRAEVCTEAVDGVVVCLRGGGATDDNVDDDEVGADGWAFPYVFVKSSNSSNSPSSTDVAV
ncbi:hypothetical protein BX616_010983 [Lobosporangium transversale]|nr:hypothetical protein BX616_010983 [Lobosporangium transversale]